MIIKKYGDLPLTYAPDIGEIVYARRNPIDRWTRAVVVHVRRIRTGPREGALRVKLVWLEDNPDGTVTLRGINKHRPIVANTVGWVIADQIEGVPPLLMQVDRDTPPPVSSSRPARTESDG